MNAFGKILSSLKGTCSPFELTRQDITSFQGQILFNDPIIKPVKIASVKFLYLTKSHFNILENVSKPTIDGVHLEALKILKKKKDVINQTNLYELIATTSKENLSVPFIDSVLDLFEDIVK